MESMSCFDTFAFFQPTGMGMEGNIHFVEIHQELGKKFNHKIKNIMLTWIMFV